MIIWIDKNNEVVSVAQGVLEELAVADNVTSFCVESLAIHECADKICSVRKRSMRSCV